MTSNRSPLAQRAPEWLPHRYDAERDHVHFVRVDRAFRRKEPFLSAQALEKAEQQVVTRASLSPICPAAPVNFILHSAYCGSTLLANMLDCDLVATSLKEPQILNDIVGWRQRGGDRRQVIQVLDDALSLLAAPFNRGEAVILKPSNVCNGLAFAMMEARPDSQAVLLYAPLRVYLASIARKGLWSRRWARELLVRQLEDGMVGLGFGVQDHVQHTDLEAAAVGWLAQHQLFLALAARWPKRVRFLNSEIMIGAPAESLGAVAAHLGLNLPPQKARFQADAHAGFDAKDGTAFPAGQREQNTRASIDRFGEEIAMICTWATAVAQHAGFSTDAPLSLSVAV